MNTMSCHPEWVVLPYFRMKAIDVKKLKITEEFTVVGYKWKKFDNTQGNSIGPKFNLLNSFLKLQSLNNMNSVTPGARTTAKRSLPLSRSYSRSSVE